MSLELFSLLLTLSPLPPAAPPAAPSADPAPQPAAHATERGGVDWFEGAFSNALGKAGAEQRNVLVYFWMEGSENCQAFEQETLGSEPAQKAFGEYVNVSAKYGHAMGAKLFERYGVRTVPSILILRPDGRGEDVIVGYISHDGFLSEMERIGRGEMTVTTLRKSIGEEPENLELLSKLLAKLSDVGDQEAADELRGSIRERDPKGKTVVGAQLILQELIDTVWREGYHGEDGRELSDDEALLDPKPLVAFLKKTKHDSILFQGWEAAREMYSQNGDVEGVCEAMREAWDYVPNDDNKILDRSVAYIDWSWQHREDLKNTHKKFLDEVAMTSLSLARSLDPEGERFLDQFVFRSALVDFVKGKKSDALKTLEAVLERGERDEYKDALVVMTTRK